VPAFQALALGRERDAAGGFSLLNRVVDGKAEDEGEAAREVGLEAVEDGFGCGCWRVVAEVLYGLKVLGEGVAEGGRLAVKGGGVVGVGPVGFGRNTEKHHSAHGRPEVGAGVAAHLHQVAGSFVEEETRGIQVAAEGAALVVLNEADAGVSCARAELTLVFYGRAVVAEVNGSRQGVGFNAFAEGRMLLPDIFNFFSTQR